MTISVQENDFDVSAEVAALTRGNDDIGAVATFIGKVRGRDGERPLASMTLEHYPGMTEAELLRLADDAKRRFSLSAIRIVHRIGALVPGDNIVLVIACARHRQDAFDGCAFAMDFLKTQAPFWKKELAVDGSGDWVDARTSDDDAALRWKNAD